MDKKYNGWTNWETWNFKLWLDNEKSTYDLIQDQMKSFIKRHKGSFMEDTPTEIDKINKSQNEFQKWLEEYAYEDKPELKPSFYSDALNASIREINFHEIAKSLIDDYLSEQLRIDK